MAAGTQSHRVRSSDETVEEAPEITVCESAPGKTVFIESENTDGWIASDVTVDVLE